MTLEFILDNLMVESLDVYELNVTRDGRAWNEVRNHSGHQCRHQIKQTYQLARRLGLDAYYME